MDYPRKLVLASSSAYRKELLARLGVPFETASPGVDESARPGELPAATAKRLAVAKARALADRFPHALIIGADQVAVLGRKWLDKPGSHANATRQLRALSGKAATFHTAVCLLDATTGTLQSRVVPCRVKFRKLDERRIESYLDREQPFDCAGSAKAEGLGIALIESIATSDPTALIGLPLIALTEMLERAGLPPL